MLGFGNINAGIVETISENMLNRNGQELRQFDSYSKLKITNFFLKE